MKRNFFAVLFSSIILLSAGFIHTAAEEDHKKTFVVLGDSIARGFYGTNDPATESYAAIVSAGFDFELKNLAVDGDKSEDLLKLLLESEPVKEAVRSADYINISIGGNDFLSQNVLSIVSDLAAGNNDSTNAVLKVFRKNFAEIMSEVKSLNPNAIIIIQNIYPPTTIKDETSKAALTRGLAMLNREFSAYLDENPDSFYFLDVCSSFLEDETLVALDTIHPSVTGHSKIAELMTEKINSIEAELKAAAAKAENQPADKTDEVDKSEGFSKIGLIFGIAAGIVILIIIIVIILIIIFRRR